ncbi:MAG: hypothetical protein LBG96_07535 [Tannerella sp.]|jgi:hypothetical protein|nr:hypothetical protein [Tannerella sp.]
MKIYRGNNTEIADVFIRTDNSYEEEEVMGDHVVFIEFDLLMPILFNLGDYVTVSGQKFVIRYNESVRKEEKSRGFKYNIMFHAEMYGLQDTLFFLFGEPERVKNHDFYNGTAAQWADLIVENMNRNGSDWSVGDVIESDAINMSFRDKTCAEVLNELVSEGNLNTEYWIAGKTLHVGRREYSSNGLSLSQGNGGGLREITLSAVDDTPPLTVLYPYGSDKNLTKEYGNDYLVLPDGELSTSRNVDKYGRIEKSVQFEHIFPKGEFHVSAKIDECTLQASDIDFDLTDCLIDGVEVIVTFQGTSGLAGYDLAIKDGSWNNSTKQFTLVKNEQENALEVPGDIHFAVGDMFILTGLKMPQSYITAAELKLEEAAQKFLDENSDKRVQLQCRCDDVYFRANNVFVACGQMARVVDSRFDIDREIRCTAVRRYLENTGTPYRYEITLSDFLVGNGLKDIVSAVKNVPQDIARNVNPVKEYTKRSWADVKETLAMMFDPEGDYFTDFIKPLVVHTAQLIVGTNSQQMSFTGVRFIPNYNGDPNTFRYTSGTLDHFTVNGDGTVRTWNIPASSTVLLSNSSAYYVYAKCTRAASATAASVLLTTNKITVDSDADYYHFLVGVLNTPIDGVRSWQPAFGYTEIAGNQITTGVIKDYLSRIVINLTEGTIYGKVSFAGGTSGYDNISDKPDIAGAISTASTNLKNYIDGAFSDGIIDKAEAVNIVAYLNVLATEKADIDARYTALYGNTTLSGTAKSYLYSAKSSLNTYYTNLVNVINSSISDGKITDAEADTINTYYTGYKGALSMYSTRHEEAHNYISSQALEAAEAASNAANTAQSTASGKATVYYNTSVSYVPSGVKANDLLCTGVEIYRWSGSAWVLVSEFYNTKTVINGGLISTGALIVGTSASAGEGGIAGGGTIRIWSGGTVTSGTTAPSSATFTVDKDGVVSSKNSFVVYDANGRQAAGFTSVGTNWGSENPDADWVDTRGSLRMWVGGEYASRDNAHFKVYTGGSVQMSAFMVTNAVNPASSNVFGIFGSSDVLKMNMTTIQCKGLGSSDERSTLNVNNGTYGNSLIPYVDINRPGSTNEDSCAVAITANGTVSGSGDSTVANPGVACLIKGGILHFDIPIVNVTTDTLWGSSNVFVFTGSVSRTKYLPSEQLLNNVYGYAFFMSFELTVIQHTGSSGETIIKGLDNLLLDNNGGTMEQFRLTRGDCATFRYIRGGWYITSARS